MIYFDTETCGLHGMPVLLQYAVDDGDIILYDIWKKPISETLTLIEWFCSQEVCGFNIAFDWFHLQKLYCCLAELLKRFPEAINDPPEKWIHEIAECQQQAVFGPCIKPKAALDLMLIARKGPYQSLMERKPIKIRRIPQRLAPELAKELEKIQFDDMYFARRKDKYAPRWKIEPIEDNDDFVNITLRFSPSMALKVLANKLLELDPLDILLYQQVELDKIHYPTEYGWAPTKGNWPDKIQIHIDHWAYNTKARQYASDDVKYTRAIKKKLGNPPAGDDDSELACCVASVRWRGYPINLPKLLAARQEAELLRQNIPTDPRSVRAYLAEVMSPTEQAVLTCTDKVTLEAIVKDDLFDDEVRDKAAKVLAARSATKLIELYDKLLFAGRFHPSFKVIGTLSGRMSGSDDLNPQGIPKGKKGDKHPPRAAFTLSDNSFNLCGGDFDAFEVVILVAVYDDKKLIADLGSGKKIHAIMGTKMFPDKTYDEVRNDVKLYTLGKNGVFSLAYFGNEDTLVNKYGVERENAENAVRGFLTDYKEFAEKRKIIIDQFCSMRQPKGIGTRVEWHEPADYIESIFGFRRYFTLENRVCKKLFELASDPPAHWKQFKFKVVRRDREQTAFGAVQSALYGAAFQIQAANMRAAGNHVIQSSGANITKYVQRKVWDFQPSGVNSWIVIPMNIHDEILAPVTLGKETEVKEIVNSAVENFRGRVPLIKMEWKIGMKSWAEK